MKLALILAALTLAGAASAAPVDLAKGKQIAESICVGCHAADGNSNIAMYPRVAGQHAAYIFKQTVDIKAGTRTTGASAAMAPMVQSLSDDDIRNVAAYYARQQAKPGEANPKENIPLGTRIYRGGLAQKGVPACMSCHGPTGSGTPGGGTDVAAYPRLGGQHGTYVADQLRAYAQGKRTSPNNMMEDIAKRMNEDEIKAVSNFIQGLK